VFTLHEVSNIASHRVYDAILVLNCGSSSLKTSVYRIEPSALALVAAAHVEAIGTAPVFTLREPSKGVIESAVLPATTDHASGIDTIVERASARLEGIRFVAAAHRVVHGGMQFDQPVRIDPGVTSTLEQLIPLAPLHQPHALAGIRAVASRAPHLPQVACFDTAFHRSQPSVAQRIALPRRFTENGVCRYGFHGLSYEYIASVLPQLDPAAARGRTVVAHLGHGASLCAMKAGRSVATTMGFTPADGLVMGTRTGSIDPGLAVYLAETHQLDAKQLEHLFFNESGLLGVSGISGEMQKLVVSTDPRAAEAIELFVYRASQELGAMAATLEGLDALIFTAGIGEHAPSIRARVGAASAWLGIGIDPEANAAGGPKISSRESRVNVWVVPTDEELIIARHARRVLAL
jgi:acetate kinase